MSDYDSLLASAIQLPVDVKVRFIEALWETVPDESLPPLSEEWVVEIERRSAEFRNGGLISVPWEPIRADARRRAGMTVLDEAR